MKLFVDSPAFMAQLERDVAGATRSIHAQVMSFEGDEAGKRFASLLKRRHDLQRTLIIDCYSLVHISDRFLFHPLTALDPALWKERRETLRVARDLAADGVRVHWTNPVGVLFLEFMARNHKKAVVVDDRIVYLGGINVCDHNFAWRDIMLRIEDERVGAFMRDDIAATLRGENLSSRRDFGGLEIALLDGESNLRLNEPVLRLIREARDVDCHPERLPHVPALRLPRRRHGPGRRGHGRHAERQQQAQDDGCTRSGPPRGPASRCGSTTAA